MLEVVALDFELAPFETDDVVVVVFAAADGAFVVEEDVVALSEDEVDLPIARACTVCC